VIGGNTNKPPIPGLFPETDTDTDEKCSVSCATADRSSWRVNTHAPPQRSL
jgi:hypothetical protein